MCCDDMDETGTMMSMTFEIHNIRTIHPQYYWLYDTLTLTTTLVVPLK